MYRFCFVKQHSVLGLGKLNTTPVSRLSSARPFVSSLPIFSLPLFCLLVVSIFTASSVHAQDSSANNTTIQSPVANSSSKKYTGWSFNVDNDVLAGGSLDQDYTGGMALAITGEGTRKWLFSLDKVRETVSRVSGFDRLLGGSTQQGRNTIEFGFTLFTPSDITIAEPIEGDHPYASLFFVANAAQFVVPEKKLTYQSVFTVGALGLDLADSIQSGIHSAIDSNDPKGWDNQISSGGEPTARFSLSVQKTLIEGGGPGFSGQFSINSEANIGFTTDVSVGFGARYGALAQPWHTFNPHPSEYISIGAPPEADEEKTKKRREYYVYAGVNLKLRLYNAILQGQFRDTEFSYDYDELNPVIAEGLAGFLTEVRNGYRFGMYIRARSAEIDVEKGRSPVWGGFLISRAIQ